MSEFAEPSFETENAFLIEHETEIRNFLHIIHGQVDHASTGWENDGSLKKPIFSENIFAVKWDTVAPQLPNRLAALASFEAGVAATIHARYRYGQEDSMVNVWISPSDKAHRTFSLTLIVDLRTGDISEYSTAGGCENRGEVFIREQDAREVIDAIFAENPTYIAQKDRLSISDAFQLGIASQVDMVGELYTVDVADKKIAANSRMRNRLQGSQFDLEVEILDRSHPRGEPCKTLITLRRHVEPVDYDPEAVLDGVFEQVLEIVQDVGGKVSSISRKSSVAMFDEPVITNVNGEEAVITLLNEVGDDIPTNLSNKLYPNEQPTLEDLRLFQRLVTQPVAREDLYIS